MRKCLRLLCLLGICIGIAACSGSGSSGSVTLVISTDVTPPSAPSSVNNTASSTTVSIPISWTASTDDVAVAGYTVYVNSTATATLATTTYTASGLSCGTAYAIAVDAYDAAGNRSAKTSISASTAACANIVAYLSPTGSDANPCSQAAPCATFARGYQAASPGQTVQVAAGAYAAQTIPYTLAKADGAHCDWASNNPSFVPLSAEPVADYSGCITFDPAPGAAVTVGGDGLILEVPYVRIRNMSLGGIALGRSPTSGSYTCAQLKAHDLVADGVTITNGTFYIAADHAVLMNSSVDFGDSLGGTLTAHVRECLINGNVTQRSYMAVIHNTIKNLLQVVTDGAHMEAIHVEAGQHILVSRNTFLNNAGHNLSAQCQLFSDCHDWRIENNFFDGICSHQVTTAQGGHCTIQGGDGFSCGGQTLINAGMYFNTFLTGVPAFILTGIGCSVTGTLQVVGNLAVPMPAFTCSTYQAGGVTYDYNVWDNAGATNVPCGSTNGFGAFAFLDPLTPDLHITTASGAINFVPATVLGGCPTLDIDGQTRPPGARCDAGADQH